MNSKPASFELYATWKHLSSQCCHTLFEKAVITGHFSNCLHACVFVICTTLLACSLVDAVKTPDMRLGLVSPHLFFRQSGEWTHADWLWDCVKGYSTSCRPSLQTAKPENIGSAIFVFPCHVWTRIVWLLKSLYGNITLTSLLVILVNLESAVMTILFTLSKNIRKYCCPCLIISCIPPVDSESIIIMVINLKVTDQQEVECELLSLVFIGILCWALKLSFGSVFLLSI